MMVLHDSSYDANTTHMGKGAIPDAISCEVTEVLNGEYYLDMVYPVGGIRYNDFEVRDVILTPVVPDGSILQPFRITDISKPLNGRVSIHANHISYDLSGYIIAPYTSATNETVSNVLTYLFSNTGVASQFSPYTNKATTGTFVNRYHSSLRNNLAGRRGSVLDKYGGEFEWDGFTVKLLNRRGRSNSNIRIEYGKNLVGLNVMTDASNWYSHVQAFWYDSETHAESNGSRISTGASGFFRVLLLDASDDYETMPVASTLNTYASNYISTHDISTPNISIDANFVDLSQAEEYKNYRQLEAVELGDTVTVFHAGMNVNINTRVKQTVYDVLRNRFTSVKLGSIRANIVDQIVSNNVVAKDAMTAVQMKSARTAETDKCLKLAGGTMTGQIERSGNGGAYYKGRDNAPLKTTDAPNSGYFYPGGSIKTGSGSWDIGVLGEDLIVHYQSDLDYTANTNSGTAFKVTPGGDFSGNAANVTGVVDLAHGGTNGADALTGLSNLWSTTPSFSAPTLGTYASGVSGGYLKIGKLVHVHCQITARTSDTTAGTRTMLTGLPNVNSAAGYAAMSITPSSNSYTRCGCFVNTSGQLRFVLDATMAASAVYYADGWYMTD